MVLFLFVTIGPFFPSSRSTFFEKLEGTRARYCTVPQSKRSSWRRYEIVLMWTPLCTLFGVDGKPLNNEVAFSSSVSYRAYRAIV